MIQNKPGATRLSTPRSGSSANANSNRTISPNGAICCIVTRDRASMRRSFPATSRTSCHRVTRRLARSLRPGIPRLRPLAPRPLARSFGRGYPGGGPRSLSSALRSSVAPRAASRAGSTAWPAVRTTSRSASARVRSSSWDAMSTVRPSLGAARTISSSTARPSASSPACGSSRSRSRGSRDHATASASRRRWPADSFRCTTSRAPTRPTRSSAASAVDALAPRGPSREAQVLPHGEVVVAERLVAHEREVAASAAAIASEVVVEHDRFARVERHEPCEQPQQRGLARAVRSREEHDLARGDVEIDPGEGGEAVEQADGGAETDDGGHTRLRAVDDKRVYERSARWVEPAHARAPLPCADAAIPRRDRPRPDHGGHPPPALRRVSALGHRHLRGPSPETSSGASSSTR